MGKFLDIFTKKSEPNISVCVSSSGDVEVQNYTVKDDRSSKVTYDGIGRVKYGAGIPPAVYDTAINAIKKFPVVYGAVTARSDAISGLGVKVFDVKGGQESEVKDHAFYQVYKNPNPFQGSFEFMEQVSQSLDITGNAFISIEQGGGLLGTPCELYLLPSKYMSIIPDPKKKIKEYHYYINGQFIKYAPEEIIHIKYSDVDDSYYGAPPLASATDILTFEGYRIAFSNQFFKNGAIPLGILATEQVLGDSLLKKLRGEWERLHGGVTNAHRTAILQGGLEYQAISSPIKDLDLSNLKRLSKDDILTIFKMPDSVLGNLEGTGGKEGKDALATFWRTSLIPHARRIESAINRGLRTLLFKNGKQIMKFNLKAVEALSDDKESVAKYLSILLSASVLTPNEARSIVGMPPSADPNADSLFISNSTFGNLLLPADQAAQTTPQANNQEKPTVKPGAAPTPAAEPSGKPAAKT